ncbi:MAG: hypothetical protein AB7F19_05050 [Candidatus Babeliales bacterium]
MKKFMQVSLCLALLGGTVMKAHKPGTFDRAADAAKGATFVATGAFLATGDGRAALGKLLIPRDEDGNINGKHVTAAAAVGLAAYLMESYKLHNQLRKLPAGDTMADFVENHKGGVAVGALVATLWLCATFLKAASPTL